MTLWFTNISQAVFSCLTEKQPQPKSTKAWGLLCCEAATKYRAGRAAAPPLQCHCADPPLSVSGRGERRPGGSCCFCQHISGISESYHHLLLILLSSLLLRKAGVRLGAGRTSPAGWAACSHLRSLWRSPCPGRQAGIPVPNSLRCTQVPTLLWSAWAPRTEQVEVLPGCCNHAFTQAVLLSSRPWQPLEGVRGYER